MTLTREAILASRGNRKPHRLEVPEWGGEVFVRVLSAKDQAELSDETPPAEMPIRVLLHCLVDSKGDRIFNDGDFEALAGEDFPVIMRVFAFAAKVNGLSTKELEEAMESFAPAPAERSSTE